MTGQGVQGKHRLNTQTRMIRRETGEERGGRRPGVVMSGGGAQRRNTEGNHRQTTDRGRQREGHRRNLKPKEGHGTSKQRHRT